jgi:hypothetical protein
MSLLRILIFLLIALVAVSCFKEDDKVMPHQPGLTEVDTIELTSLYKYQVYYDMATGAPVASNLRNKWDLSFECTMDGWHIRLNTSCFMYATTFNSQDFGLPSDTTGATWQFDNSNGSLDSTAIGKWFSISGNDTVSNGKWYVINRGFDEEGNVRGLKQLKIDSLANDVYYFRVAGFDGTNQKAFSVRKDPSVNHVNFSFDQTTSEISEPVNNSWDLIFTQYTTLLYTDIGEPYPYLVTGVLLNPNVVEVARDSIHPFADITFDKVKGLSFSRRQDFIGYDWKFYNFTSGAYTVRSNQVFIIHDVEGYYYKFRFLGFYNKKGEKGYPSIEYQRL